MTATQTRPPEPEQQPQRRSGELTFLELMRFAWRQLTSMRTALILLLLLALAAVPGSVIPQERVDAIKTGQWQDRHTSLTPIYQRLDLFNVYGSAWFAAIYLLLVVSLLGCIVPRTFHYARALRAQPPAAPRNLTRLRDHATYQSDLTPEQVLGQARRLFRSRRYRLRRGVETDDAVSAEKGFAREAGNLLFHLAVMVVLVGFAVGSLLGYKGGVILIKGDTFTNTPVAYDDFVPGTLFRASQLDPFDFTVNHFSVDWVTSGPKAGMPRDFDADLTYHPSQGSPEQSYNLRVNHPLTIDHTELFLIGQGYAPDVTIRDGEGHKVWSGPQVFLPLSADLFSTGVIKAGGAQPKQLAFQGFLYPNFLNVGGTPTNISGAADNPLLNLTAYAGDLGLGSGAPQSVYALDKTGLSTVKGTDGQALRINLGVGQTEKLPNGLGSITFNGVDQWQRIQISQTPGKRVALGGVVLALIGLLGSLFIRSRRVWVRARPAADGRGTLVEVGLLDRSGGADTTAVLSEVVAALQKAPPTTAPPRTEKS